jgi:hypothetical protein
MCAEALWIQEIKPLFNSMKTLIILFEFAMRSLELKQEQCKRGIIHPSILVKNNRSM